MSLYNTPFLNHINELKFRLTYSLLSYLVTICIIYTNIEEIFYILIEPLISNGYEGHFIYTDIIEIVYLYIKISLIISFFFLLPLILYHIYNFMQVGLYLKEKNLLKNFLITLYLFQNIIFYLYYKYLLPFLWHFLLNFQINNINWDISLYSKITEYFSLFFQLFSITLFLIFIPILNLFFKNYNRNNNLYKNRLYFLTFFIIIILLISPPDFFSQVLIFVPTWFCYEVILFISISHHTFMAIKFNEKDGIRTHGIKKI